MIDEANRIKDRIRACQSAAEVESVANDERSAVQAMAKTDDGKTLAIQIANLKAWQLGQIKGR